MSNVVVGHRRLSVGSVEARHQLAKQREERGALVLGEGKGCRPLQVLDAREDSVEGCVAIGRHLDEHASTIFEVARPVDQAAFSKVSSNDVMLDGASKARSLISEGFS